MICSCDTHRTGSKVGDAVFTLAQIRLMALERRAVKWNHSAEVVLRQDQAVRRRPYWGYGQAGRRRSWRKTARPYGFAPGGRPLRRTARPMPHIALRRSPGGSTRRAANRIDPILLHAALAILGAVRVAKATD